MDNLPDTGMEFNTRAYEMQCCNLNGMELDDWYNMPVGQRNWKVAGMMFPAVSAAVQSIRQGQALRIPDPLE